MMRTTGVINNDSGTVALQMLSGGSTPRESMPQAGAGYYADHADDAFFVSLAGILYRGAGLEIIVWRGFTGFPAGDRRRVLP